jgi:hypothetical protein
MLEVMWKEVVLAYFKSSIGHNTEPLSSTAHLHILSPRNPSNIIPSSVFLPRWMISKKVPPHLFVFLLSPS